MFGEHCACIPSIFPHNYFLLLHTGYDFTLFQLVFGSRLFLFISSLKVKSVSKLPLGHMCQANVGPNYQCLVGIRSASHVFVLTIK